MSKTCVLLVSHGSRDPLADLEMKKLAGAYQKRHPDFAVRFGYLEIAQPSFESELERAAKTFDLVQILPLFLFEGSHFKKDIPEIIQRVQKNHFQTQLRLKPSLGIHPAMADLVFERLQAAGYPRHPNGESTLLVGHGTREEESRALLEKLVLLARAENPAARITPCFIGLGEPSFEEILEGLPFKNPASVWIAPYFLFPGNFVEEIKLKLSNFQAGNPALKLFCSAPLGSHEFLFQILDARLGETG
jgi:sirohydrochlorin cobaltochelatase